MTETIPVMIVNWNMAKLLLDASLKSLADMNESCKRRIVERNRILAILRFVPYDKQSSMIAEGLNGLRKDGTTYHEKKQAMHEARMMLREQYPANLEMRGGTYHDYCIPK